MSQPIVTDSSTPVVPAVPAATEPPATPPAHTQADIDRIVSERLAREKAKYADYGDLQAKAARLAELEQAQMSEQEKLNAAKVAVERERDEARAETARLQAAVRHKIGEDYIGLLGSGTADEIEARAARIGELVTAKSELEQARAELEALKTGKPVPPGGRPVEALKPGATPSDTPTEDDVLYNALFGK